MQSGDKSLLEYLDNIEQKLDLLRHLLAFQKSSVFHLKQL